MAEVTIIIITRCYDDVMSPGNHRSDFVSIHIVVDIHWCQTIGPLGNSRAEESPRLPIILCTPVAYTSSRKEEEEDKPGAAESHRRICYGYGLWS